MRRTLELKKVVAVGRIPEIDTLVLACSGNVLTVRRERCVEGREHPGATDLNPGTGRPDGIQRGTRSRVPDRRSFVKAGCNHSLPIRGETDATDGIGISHREKLLACIRPPETCRTIEACAGDMLTVRRKSCRG